MEIGKDNIIFPMPFFALEIRDRKNGDRKKERMLYDPCQYGIKMVWRLEIGLMSIYFSINKKNQRKEHIFKYQIPKYMVIGHVS